jgi:HD-GYP domain-containing protein (c-di-GMP phosphodiesterase class II)
MSQNDENKHFAAIHHDQIKNLTNIGVALSGEKNIDRLLEMILDEARKYTNADGGTLYIMSEDESELLFAIIKNESLGVSIGGTGGKITWPAVKLKNIDGSPNYSNVSAYVAISGEAVNIADVYDAYGFNFEGTKKYDQENGYRSQSMLVVPMRNHDNDIIAVLQLLNAQDQVTGAVINFSLESQEMTLSLASQAAVALTNNRLIHDLENLLESFIKTIATAIDEKSPYTGGHVRRVAQLTMTIANKINEKKQGPFASVIFSDDQMRELRMAAWLHDIGKIITPEHIVDKTTKLEKVHDRIADVKTRFELIKKEYQPAMQKTKNSKADNLLEDMEWEIKTLDEEYQFLVQVNRGDEFIEDEMVERIKKIGKRHWRANSQTLPLLTEDEIYNLSVRSGTLNDEERSIINNHAAVSYKMLSGLPFPRKMRNLANYAAAHHEKMDGTGYPLGLKADQLFLQSRIIAIADIFEALTAKDRPYKKEKTVAEALKIMELMVKDHHIDADLFELFIQEEIHADYAKQELASQQMNK